ncbi:hypothetical protein I3843_08G041200 [Carya illinoinensis]|uniref:Uncharacterized protein n=1 Tax=Carya illinoinensis TaxID=32201 RepID=A0A8T1PRB3_CARIL|nr:hypothetical protein I3760_08G041500 [Carya illinoinensis]KAG6644213.1 hypothetical protein CIPAW_08G040500 [Carya illinoinensis]KAG6698878.1 hypothetical protein I3842_08G041400 [Carya illinoinensis]KAG7966255.1 hypothetical protein I3843_08G041200 [Carya illinoinensis]
MRRCSPWRRGGAMRMRTRRKKKLRLSFVESSKLTTVKSSVQRKLKQLQRIIPGCLEMDMENLFPRVANYILLLEEKVNVLKNLSTLYGV